MNNIQNKLQNFNESDFSKILYDFGFTSEEIKDFIIEQFINYFQNKNRLENNTIDNLTTSWFSYLSIQRDFKETIIYLETILDIYNSAKFNNHMQAFEAYVKWLPDFSQSITRFWGIYFGQKKLEELADEDYLTEITQLIGQSIEGVAKPFLQFTLFLNRLKRNKAVNIDDVKNKDLGVIIDELINTSKLNEALIFNNIRLNQWRNIAYHHNTKFIGGKMIFYLKRNDIIEEFETNREELKQVARSLQNLFKLIRIAETIFFLDNKNEIQKLITPSDLSQINLRKESELINLYTAIGSQGFNISFLEYDENLAEMNLTDLESYSDVIKKGIHSSQFLYHLWLLTNSKKLKVNYFLQNGTKFFSSEVNSSDFEKDVDNDIPFEELMKNVKFTYINTEIKQNVDPFEEFIFSEEIINSQQFYSQLGEKISVEDFSKKFTLSTLCNYLALKEEGAEGLKINIGNNGSTVISEKSNSFLLMVPAQISSKTLQTKLIELMNKIIQLYEKNLLKIEIVQMAKENNNYYEKIALIKERKKNVN